MIPIFALSQTQDCHQFHDDQFGNSRAAVVEKALGEIPGAEDGAADVAPIPRHALRPTFRRLHLRHLHVHWLHGRYSQRLFAEVGDG